MRGRSRITAVAVLFITTPAGPVFPDQAPRAAPQKPIVHRSHHVDGGVGAPATLEELWRMSPVIVDAEIRTARPADLTMAPPPGRLDMQPAVFVQTAYELRVREILKDATNGQITRKLIEVVQIGGDRDRGDVIESVSDPTFPRLELDERYIFFLKPNRSGDGALQMATDSADSALLLADDATVRARGTSAISATVEKYNREDLLNVLRNLRDAWR
jgi:hypothetical protein